MRFPRTALAVLAVVPLALAGCSDSGTSTARPSSAAPSGPAPANTQVCAPVAGSELVALTDDENLQNSDNIVPVVRTDKVTPALREALDNVTAALTQDALVRLNQATDVARQTPEQAAKAFIEENDLANGVQGGSGPVRVVAANFSENQTLAQVFAMALTGAGFDATVVQLTNREVYEAALEKGDVDVVAEYAATLTEFLNTKANGQGAMPKASGSVDETVAALSALAEPRGLTVLTPAEATDQNAFAVTRAFADKYAVTSLSELADACGGGVSLGGPPECPQRPFCQPGLEKTYDLKVTGFTSLDAGGPLSKNALSTGKVALALVFSSDAQLVEQ